MSLSVIEHPDLARYSREDVPYGPPALCTEVYPEGELDALTLPVFAQTLQHAVEDSSRVELDLSGIDFMSLAAAAHIWRAASRRGAARSFEITAASSSASRALVVTGFGGMTEG